jgi:hypothetical protein
MTLYAPIPSTSHDPSHLPQIRSFVARGFEPTLNSHGALSLALAGWRSPAYLDGRA